MEWITIRLNNFLSSQNMTDIYNNFLILRRVLINKGYVVGDIVDCSVMQNTRPDLIHSKFQAVETNIQTIHNAIDWEDVYYKEYIWPKKPINIAYEINRWVDWLNDTYYKANQLVDNGSESE